MCTIKLISTLDFEILNDGDCMQNIECLHFISIKKRLLWKKKKMFNFLEDNLYVTFPTQGPRRFQVSFLKIYN